MTASGPASIPGSPYSPIPTKPHDSLLPDNIHEHNGSELSQFGFQSVDFGLQCEDVSLMRHQEFGYDFLRTLPSRQLS